MQLPSKMLSACTVRYTNSPFSIALQRWNRWIIYSRASGGMVVLPTRFTHVKHLMVDCGVAPVASQRHRNSKHEQVIHFTWIKCRKCKWRWTVCGCSGRLIRLFTLFTPLSVEFDLISRKRRRWLSAEPKMKSHLLKSFVFLEQFSFSVMWKKVNGSETWTEIHLWLNSDISSHSIHAISVPNCIFTSFAQVLMTNT